MSTVPYESQKMNTRELTTQLLEAHGGAFNNLMHPEGHLEGVLTFGPPGIGKTQSVMAAAIRLQPITVVSWSSTVLVFAASLGKTKFFLSICPWPG